MRALPGWEHVSGQVPWVDLYNHVMNLCLDAQVASDLLSELIRLLNGADRSTRSFPAGQQHDADDFVLEVLAQMEAYAVVRSTGQPISREVIGFVEYVVDTCMICAHGSARPPCELTVVMLGGSQERITLAERAYPGANDDNFKEVLLQPALQFWPGCGAPVHDVSFNQRNAAAGLGHDRSSGPDGDRPAIRP